MKMYEQALEFATERHEGQKRWDGGDYIRHPRSVADAFSDDLHKTVAILHDVVEDKKATLQEIRDLFGSKVAKSVDALSRKPGETYKDFVRRCAKDPVAKMVKIADIEDNMGDTSSTDPKQLEKANSLRTKRYIPALLFLQGENKEY
jgi:(p)ppGpp synthase/HD superfamily hydrolase